MKNRAKYYLSLIPILVLTACSSSHKIDEQKALEIANAIEEKMNYEVPLKVVCDEVYDRPTYYLKQKRTRTVLQNDWWHEHTDISQKVNGVTQKGTEDIYVVPRKDKGDYVIYRKSSNGGKDTFDVKSYETLDLFLVLFVDYKPISQMQKGSQKLYTGYSVLSPKSNISKATPVKRTYYSSDDKTDLTIKTKYSGTEYDSSLAKDIKISQEEEYTYNENGLTYYRAKIKDKNGLADASIKVEYASSLEVSLPKDYENYLNK